MNINFEIRASEIISENKSVEGKIKNTVSQEWNYLPATFNAIKKLANVTEQNKNLPGKSITTNMIYRSVHESNATF